MKSSWIKTYLSQLANITLNAEQEFDEVELGFDTMLSCEVIQLLVAHQSGKLAVQRRGNVQHGLQVLDEHELAVI